MSIIAWYGHAVSAGDIARTATLFTHEHSDQSSDAVAGGEPSSGFVIRLGGMTT